MTACWHTLPLHEVATIQTGLAKGGKKPNNVLRVPYLRVANVQDGFLDLTDVKEIDIEAELISRYLLRDGDVLLTEGGDFDKLGRGTVWNGQVDPCVHQNHVFVARVNKVQLDPYYLTALTSSPYGKRYFLSCAKQTTNLASINATQLREFPVLLPPLAEQHAITAILATWDRAIEQTTRLIEAERRLKQGLMQQLLTGKSGEVKRIWFTDFAEVNPARKIVSKESPYLEMAGVQEQFGGIREIGHRPTPASGSRFCDGDVLFARITPCSENGKIAFVHSLGDGVIAHGSTEFIVLAPKKDAILPKLLFYICCSEEVHGYAITHMEGTSGRQRIPASIFDEIKVVLPKKEEQVSLVSLFDALTSEVDLLRRLHEAFSAQKQALMQKLLTGQVRVKGVA